MLDDKTFCEIHAVEIAAAENKWVAGQQMEPPMKQCDECGFWGKVGDEVNWYWNQMDLCHACHRDILGDTSITIMPNLTDPQTALADAIKALETFQRLIETALEAPGLFVGRQGNEAEEACHDCGRIGLIPSSIIGVFDILYCPACDAIRVRTFPRGMYDKLK